MGFTEWMEKKAQQSLCRRAMEAAWTGMTCIGMVYGPLTLMLKSGSPTTGDVLELTEAWLSDWTWVCQLSDRNLRRNRAEYLVRPNLVLSPILADFLQTLLSIRAKLTDPQEMLEKIHDAQLNTTASLFEFNNWIKEEGKLIGFDAERYQDVAAQRSQRVWRKAQQLARL